MRLIWAGRETENFLTGDWTTQITLIRFNKTAFCGNRRPVERFPAKLDGLTAPGTPSAPVLMR
jgi:hypothetical protein